MITIDETQIPHITINRVTNRQLLLTGAVGGVVGVVLSATAFSFAFPPEHQKRPYLSDIKKWATEAASEKKN